MKRYAIAAGIFLALCAAALADTTIAPGQRTSVAASGTITLGGTFQQWLPQNANRTGCYLQNTSTHTLFVFLGATATASLTNTIQVAPGGAFSCASPGGTIVVTDAIQITTSTTSDPFVGFWQS
jgi:hypothetical protein